MSENRPEQHQQPPGFNSEIVPGKRARVKLHEWGQQKRSQDWGSLFVGTSKRDN